MKDLPSSHADIVDIAVAGLFMDRYRAVSKYRHEADWSSCLVVIKHLLSSFSVDDWHGSQILVSNQRQLAAVAVIKVRLCSRAQAGLN